MTAVCAAEWPGRDYAKRVLDERRMRPLGLRFHVQVIEHYGYGSGSSSFGPGSRRLLISRDAEVGRRWWAEFHSGRHSMAWKLIYVALPWREGQTERPPNHSKGHGPSTSARRRRGRGAAWIHEHDGAGGLPVGQWAGGSGNGLLRDGGRRPRLGARAGAPSHRTTP